MIAILLVGLLACASAAPQWRRHHSALSPFDGSLERSLSEERIVMFWDEWTRNLNRGMVETRLSDIKKYFPDILSMEGIEGNEYRITILLDGFEEKDITVKVSNGLLNIQAVHSGANVNTYSEVRPLPMYVSEQVSWSYENGVLKVVLPVVQSSESGSKEDTPAAVTPVPDRSHEETNNPVYADEDIDLARGDLDKTNEIPTELPKVEATINAVDNYVELININN